MGGGGGGGGGGETRCGNNAYTQNIIYDYATAMACVRCARTTAAYCFKTIIYLGFTVSEGHRTG